jgi:Glycogen debranching enzyme, glucanotransferase domain
MPGLRILNIHPRLAGPISRWRDLIAFAVEMGFNAAWFNPFHKASDVAFNENGKRRVQSLYAIMDYFDFDQAVTSGDRQRDREELRTIILEARRLGLCIMADLVFNHVAVDHPLVVQETHRIREIQSRPGWRHSRTANGSIIGIEYPRSDGISVYYFKFARNLEFEVVDFDGTTGYDNAQINFNSPAAYRFFIEGENGEAGYWKQVLDYYLELGFRGFRCDIAYKIPARWWCEIIEHAHHREPQVVFLAETLGGKEKNNQLADAQVTLADECRPAFDLVMLSTYWWDMLEEWMREEIALSHKISRYGGAGSPDNHDLDTTLAEQYLRRFREMRPERTPGEDIAIQRLVAGICVRNYAVAALLGNSVYATMGYLFCLDQTSVFSDPQLFAKLRNDWNERKDPEHPLNIQRHIAAINRFVEKLPLRHALVHIHEMPRTRAAGERTLIEIKCVLRDVESRVECGRLFIFVDARPEDSFVLWERGAICSERSSALREELIREPRCGEEVLRLETPYLAAYYVPSRRISPVGARPARTICSA